MVQIWLGVLLLGLSIFLGFRGVRGRRVGNEPRCPECEYDLTDLASRNCPECGWFINDKQVESGRLRVRWIALLNGAIWFLTSILILTVPITEVDWYSVAPYQVLAYLAEDGNKDSLAEIRKRVVADQLTAGQYKHLGDLCLSKQRSVTKRPSGAEKEWLALLQGLYYLKHLTYAQQQRYFEQSITDVRFTVRPRVREGGPFPLQLTFLQTTGVWLLSEFDSSFLMSDVSRERIRLHGASPTEMRDFLFVSSWPNKLSRPLAWDGSGECSIYRCGEMDAPAARYMMTYSATIDLQRGSGTQVVWSKEVQFEREIRVDYTDSVDVVRFPLASDDINLVKGLFSVRGGDWLPSDSQVPARINSSDPERILEFKLSGPLPVPVAFDVEIEAPSGTYPVGWIAADKGDTGLRTRFQRAGETIAPRKGQSIRYDEVLVKLRPSETVAEETIDIDAIWNRELTLGPVRLGLPTPAILPPP